jgi:hypothetical protein
MNAKIKTREIRENRTMTSNFAFAKDNIDIYVNKQLVGFVHDTSATGFMFISNSIFNRGTNLRLEIELQSNNLMSRPNHRIPIKANVRWNDPKISAIGIQVLPQDIPIWKQVQTHLRP